MRLKKKVWFLLICMVLLFALPVQAQAAKSKITVSGASKPGTLTKGSSFSLKGKITSKQKLKEIRCTIYNSTNKVCLQRYIAYPNAKTYQLTNADPYLIFDRLNTGTYYYKVLCIDARGYQKRVISKKFKVKGNGVIKITNPMPGADITLNAGSAYAIGGRVQSTYNIRKITAQILGSDNKVVYGKTINLNTKSYNLKGSVLDNAMYFDRLTAGTYKYKLTVTDNQGQSAVVVYRGITVNGGSSNVSPNSTGGGTVNNTTYLNANGAVETPAGFVPRITRPAADNPYYYDGTYNIYAKYNSLAPTGRKFNGKHYVTGNCTWYACGRAMEIVAAAGGNVSKVQSFFGGDPVGIFNTNIKKGAFSYGMEPKVGSLVIFNYGANGDAHIAVVEAVVNGVPYVSESGYATSTKKPSAETIVFQYQSVYNWAGGRQLLGYIYLI